MFIVKQSLCKYIVITKHMYIVIVHFLCNYCRWQNGYGSRIISTLNLTQRRIKKSQGERGSEGLSATRKFLVYTRQVLTINGAVAHGAHPLSSWFLLSAQYLSHMVSHSISFTSFGKISSMGGLTRSAHQARKLPFRFWGDDPASGLGDQPNTYFLDLYQFSCADHKSVWNSGGNFVLWPTLDC